MLNTALVCATHSEDDHAVKQQKRGREKELACPRLLVSPKTSLSEATANVEHYGVLILWPWVVVHLYSSSASMLGGNGFSFIDLPGY